MEKLTVAFLYNVRHQYPDPNDPRTQLEADFDDPQTIDWMLKHLKNCFAKVIPVEADESAYFKLFKYRKEIDVVFNYSEGIYGKDREAQLPAILEMLKIPYTGSSPLTQALVLNKAKTKEILLENKIPTAPFQIFNQPKEKLHLNLNFPLIVKPLSQGSSAGITNKSVVKNKKELENQVGWIIKTFSQPALVETFLSGRDLSVAMLGNPPKILPIIESDHSKLPKGYQPIDSLEVKWLVEEKSKDPLLICPANLPDNLKKKIEKICFSTWQALEIQDWCRIDIRCDQRENPFVLEVNSPCGMIPPEVSVTSYFPLAARTAGIDYKSLLIQIIKSSLTRYRHI